MKLLNKLLKQISLFDITFFLILVVAGLIFFLFFYRKAEYITIRVKVTEQEVLYANTRPTTWYANRFEIGDQELDALGRKITEIVGIERFNVESNRKAVYVDLEIRATYDTRTRLYSARGKTLVFGTPVRFNLSRVTFDGIVTEFPGSQYQKNLKVSQSIVKVLARALEPAIANSIRNGDKVHDSSGVLLAEVKDILISPAERVTTPATGNLLLRLDPLYKDVSITVLLRTKTYQGEAFVFDNIPLKIGEILPLNFSQVSISPIITGFDSP